MIAPVFQRAPRMLLVIGQDDQGLPTETIILQPSVWQLLDGLRASVAALLPDWLGDALRPHRPVEGCGLPVSESALIDARLRWAGL
jgi:hypothetical protein